MEKDNQNSEVQDKIKERKFWNKCAEERIYAAFDEEEYNYVFDKFLGNIKNKKVIDIGCASGTSAMLLAMRGADAVGIDISPKLIEQANNIKKDMGIDVEFKVGDAEKLDFENESIDVCFYGGVIHHFPDKSKCIEECYCILKPQGIFLAIEPNYRDIFQRLNWKIARRKKLLSINEDLVDPIKLKKILIEKGFENVVILTFRVHVSFIGLLIPKVRRYFGEHGEATTIEKIIRFPFDLFRDRDKLEIGNFFCMAGNKK
jgi:ubiquinone/menaquinone biosynthesis C-methylase UbiE